MKFRCERDTLTEAIATAAKTVAAKKPAAKAAAAKKPAAKRATAAKKAVGE